MNREEAIKIVKSHYPANKQMLNEALETLIPEIKESEDERIRKELIQFIKNWKDPNNIGRPHDFPTLTRNVEQCDRYIAWLEKQCEKKFVEWSEEDSVRLQRIIDFLWYNRKGDTDAVYQQEQDIDWLKSLKNKVEPKQIESKFHEGDWIIYCDYEPVQIISIKMNAYEMSNGDIRPVYMVDNNPIIRLWNINDAKDGDVLASENGSIILVKESRGSSWGYRLSYHCAVLHDGTFEPREFHVNPEKFFPASKGQRDTLMKVITDAGWEWDSKSKELTRRI